MPDLEAAMDKQERILEAFGVSEQKLHFIDIEIFMQEESRRRYVDNLSGRPRIADFPRDIRDARYAKAGMLPFSVEHSFGQMVRSIRENRLDDEPRRYPRDNHAARWAGYLAHYVEDNTQPHHATLDYQSRSYFKAPIKAPSVHGDIEYRLLDDELNDYPTLRQELWERFVAALDGNEPVTDADPWTSTLQVALISYEALPMIGRAAVTAYPNAGPDGPGQWDAEKFFHYKDTYLGKEMTVMEMKAHQYAWAVKRLERIWRMAWDEAKR
jgi:hypothetical protein